MNDTGIRETFKNAKPGSFFGRLPPLHDTALEVEVTRKLNRLGILPSNVFKHPCWQVVSAMAFMP